MWLADMFETAFGWAAVVYNDRGYVKNLTLPTDKSKAEGRISGFPQKPFPLIESKLRRYFDGKRVDFEEIKLFTKDGAPFEKLVYEALREVPYGQVVTYSWLASMAGSPRAERAVGNAMKRNPVPLIMPCHRVIRKDGTTGGFSADGGAEMKRKMLELEGACSARVRHVGVVANDRPRIRYNQGIWGAR